MNVTFHVLGSLATAAVLSKGKTPFALWKYACGFAAGILLHGVLDFSPHQYPLSSKIDVVLALILLAFFSFLVPRRNLLLFWVCYAGAIFPDVLDLSPEIIYKYLGITIPHLPFKIFPWHWKQYSGSIYDGSGSLESSTYYFLVLLISLVLLYAYRKYFFKFWRGNEP